MSGNPFGGWAEAQGYTRTGTEYNLDEMADAFAAGMQAQRDVSAVTGGPAPELAAAMAGTRQLLGLVDEITGDITRKSGTTSAYLLRKAASVRQRAGLDG